ncbi:MAG: MFS transporter [Porticoccaceae bacterium]|nr:MFS transporter [Porticoccaceae bacterium]
MSIQSFSFRYFLVTIGLSNLGMGLQKVLYPWLVVGVLELSPSHLGLAQLAVLLPSLLFVLLGGVVSDRLHRGRWLSVLYLLYFIPVGGLSVFFWLGSVSFLQLVIFGTLFGTITAFVQPARESLLGYAAPEIMHQAVAKVMVVQFIAQGAGFIVAGQLDIVDPLHLLCFQLLVFLLSSIFIRRSHPLVPEVEAKQPPKPPTSLKNLITELKEGLVLFRHNKSLLHLILIVFATGFLAFGVYLVGVPLIAKQLYGGGATLYAGLQIAFTLGIISVNLGVMNLANMFFKSGRLMVLSFLARGTLVALVALKPSLWLLFPLIYIWGVFTGLSMTLGRTILHNEVPDNMRSRAVSIYQLCLYGGAPLGALICGLTVEWIGLRDAFFAIAWVTLALSIVTALRSPLWHVKSARSVKD